jgi:small subunit ribosomal protein S1
VSGPVIEVVKGGLIIDIGLRGFLPASLVELRRVRDLAALRRASTLEAKIIELDKNRNNVVLSRRAWLEETQKEQREEFLTNLKPGEIRNGVVSAASSTSVRSSTSAAWTASSTCPSCRGSTSTTPVRSWPSATRSPFRCSRSTSTASASASRSRPPSRIRGRSSPSGHHECRRARLRPGHQAGAVRSFVQVGDGIEGLVHISEMSAHHVDLPEQVVTPGEELWVKIIDLDLQRRGSACRSSRLPRVAYQVGAYDDEYRWRVHRGAGSLGRVRRTP